MRYYAPETASVLSLPAAQRHFFFRGPLYLLRLGLRREAAGLAVLMWAMGQLTYLLTRTLVWPVLESARGALELLVLLPVAYRTAESADAVLAELIVLLMPWLAALFAAVLVVALTTVYLPDLLDSALRRRGFRRLQDEDVDEMAAHAA